MTPQELADRLMEFDPSDEYHKDEAHPIDSWSYYTALNRAARLVLGELGDWKDRG